MQDLLMLLLCCYVIYEHKSESIALCIKSHTVQLYSLPHKMTYPVIIQLVSVVCVAWNMVVTQPVNQFTTMN